MLVDSGSSLAPVLMGNSEHHFVPCSSLPEGIHNPPLLIAVNGQQVACATGSSGDVFFSEFLAPSLNGTKHLLGVFDGQPCYAVDASTAELPSGMSFVALRSLLGDLNETRFQLAGRACQIVQWDKQHRYCGRCGRVTTVIPEDRSRACDSCEERFYPRLSPCVIVVIRRGEYCLLASSARWEGRYYSALAGFIEPGETVEQALHREVMEEVGIRVSNLTYFASQPWPFPGQLMLGFHADYLSGDIQVDGEEIVAADWWHYRDLPPHPDENTLSGQLIRHFVATCREAES